MSASPQLHDAAKVIARIRARGAQPRLHRLPDTRTRLAVLPFADLSEDRGLFCVTDVLMVLLIANLSVRPALRVVSRTSTLRYRGSAAPVAEIARELNVGCVVEGSVLQTGGQLQIIVALVDAAADTPILTRTYTGQHSTIRHMQAAIAWAITDEIAAAIDQR